MDTEAVVDSSVIVALVTPEKQSDWASKTSREYTYLHVLDLSFYEVANAIEHKVSSNFDKEDATAAFRQAERIMNLYTIHRFSEVLAQALNTALENNISVYDAAFLTLANKLNSKLVTLDMKLSKKLEGSKYFNLIESP